MHAAPKPSVRSVFAAAILIMAAIFAWRTSGAVTVLLHDYHVHLTAVAHPADIPAHPASPPLIIFQNLGYGYTCRAASRDSYHCTALPPVHEPRP
jgi:hypothetical protein